MRFHRSALKRCRKLIRLLRDEVRRLPGAHGSIVAATEVLQRILDADRADPAAEGSSPAPGEEARLRGRIVMEFLRQERSVSLEGEDSPWSVVFPGRHFSAAEVLLFLSFNRKSGMVVVQTEDERIMVELRDGVLVDAVSDGAPAECRLGEILVEQGDLTEDRLREILSKQDRRDRRIGQVLFESGVVGDEELARALRTQIQRHLKRCLTAENPQIEFHPGLCDEVPIALHLDLNAILLESLAELEGPAVVSASPS